MFRLHRIGTCMIVLLTMVSVGCLAGTEYNDQPTAQPFVLILGSGQDAGVPQAGGNHHPGWDNPACRRLASSLALVDPASGQRWLFDASPDFPAQLRLLDLAAPAKGKAPDLAGIFLTHAHIGHYTGLMYLGRESIGAEGVKVHAMPRMQKFLRQNGPWSQLVSLGNIQLMTLQDRQPVVLTDSIQVTPILVPHRDEFSETVGFKIRTARHRLLYLPDIDYWEAAELDIDSLVAEVDVALLDGTFFSDQELPGRDMSSIPHPRVVESMERFKRLAAEKVTDIRFIHLNQSNPLVCRNSTEIRQIQAQGFDTVSRGERIPMP